MTFYWAAGTKGLKKCKKARMPNFLKTKTGFNEKKKRVLHGFVSVFIFSNSQITDSSHILIERHEMWPKFIKI